MVNPLGLVPTANLGQVDGGAAKVVSVADAKWTHFVHDEHKPDPSTAFMRSCLAGLLNQPQLVFRQ